MSDDLADDPLHPIPSLKVIDYVRTIQGGGAGYVLVIARPLQSDHRSLFRLHKKLEMYVEDFFSKESKELQDTPKPGRMWIYVGIHKDSDPEAFRVIKKFEPWMNESGIKLIVSLMDDDGGLYQAS